MGLREELELVNPIGQSSNETMMNIVLTGMLLVKEGDRVLRGLAMTSAQFNLLMLLKYQSDGGEMNQTRLGKMLLVNRANVTGLVDRLERAGWVRRSDDPEDRRAHRVCITRSGEAALEKAEPVYFARIDAVLDALTGQERADLCTALEKIRRALRRTKGIPQGAAGRLAKRR